jgi:hypothetical protein
MGYRHRDRDRFEVIWPYGFHLRVEGEPEVVDGHGKVVARAGDIIRNWGGGLQGNMISLCSVDEYPVS